MNNRTKQNNIAHFLKVTISKALNELGISKPPNPFVTIKDVEVSKDRSSAIVFVSYIDEKNADKNINIILNQKKEIMNIINKKSTIRKMLHISFAVDYTDAKADRINKLIKLSNIEK